MNNSVLGKTVAILGCTALAAALVVVGLRHLWLPARPDAAGHDAAGRDSSAAGRTAAGRSPATADAACPIQLRDVSGQTGIAFRHTDGSGGRRYIVETVTAGLATFDYDGDGRIDIYFPNGAPLPGTKADVPPRHALYKNLGGWKFRDVTEEARVACTGYGLGATAGDYDNDGRPDLFVSNFGPKVLYRNLGDGTFADVTGRAGAADGSKVGAGACFLDIDADGNLDLFAANYVKFSFATHVTEPRGSFTEYAGPRRYPPDEQTLLRNNGDGTFADVSVESGVRQHLGKGMGMVSADYDNDGDADILLLNDVFGNFCFQNDGTGKFEEVSLAAGFKYNGQGLPLGSMGVDCGDYNNDGWLDFYQTSYQDELPVLFRNLGGGTLEDATVRCGAGRGTFNNVKWGCGFVDFDNDGHRDLFIAMGHLQDEIEKYSTATSFRARNVLLRNRGDGTFEDVSDRCGDGLLPVFSSRGAAFDDLDNDGDIDVVVLNTRDQPTVLRNMLNESDATSHWLQIQLRGVKTNRDGVGARVRVTAGDLVQIAEVHSGRSYQSHFGTRLHFGLGPRDRVDRIEVRWIGGGVEILDNLHAEQLLVITEGSSGL